MDKFADPNDRGSNATSTPNLRIRQLVTRFMSLYHGTMITLSNVAVVLLVLFPLLVRTPMLIWLAMLTVSVLTVVQLLPSVLL